jgi:IS5 family transposase
VVEIRYRPSPQDAELFAQALLTLPVESWWEDWMRHADRLLDDPELVNIVHQVLLKRRPQSRTRGRLSTPAEVVLRLMVLKHVRNWSYGVLAREVRANLVYRQFTRMGHHRMPHAKTIGKLGLLLGPTVVQQLHQRVVAQAQAEKVIRGNKLRVDTTVVETNIHYPTDSVLLGDGVRVLTRVMRHITEVVGDRGEKMRDRRRSVVPPVGQWRLRRDGVGHRLIEIGRASRGRGPQVQKKLEQGYRKLLGSTGQVVAQAKRFSQEIVQGVKRSSDVLQQAALEGMKKELDTMLPRVQQVVSQTRARIIQGITNSAGKIVSLFEHTTEIIRKGKPGKPTEFGKMIKVQEAENQIIVAYQVYDQRPADSALLVPAIEEHRQRLGVVPRVTAGDAGFFSAANETAAQKMGVARVAVPSFSTKSAPRRKRQKERWFRKAQRWRIGCEGRISVLKRRHGLRRCLYKGDAGMHRWVGLGVIADTLINLGRVLAARFTPQKSVSGAP